ncbi:MAG: tyrosine-type recombinase/integrase family protein, partial [Myxococcales bacterium]|nr:tyrosine-type recombinase/integrase family protein [Myxococcales bacterium]
MTFAEFAPRFVEDHVLANRLKRSTARRIDNSLRNHLLPVLGAIRLDRIGPVEIQRLKKRALASRTINLVLTHLTTMLGAAVKWGLLAAAPEITKLKVGKSPPKFYDFQEYRGLVVSAAQGSAVTHAAVLLGGDAGMRRGELLALRWQDVDLRQRRLTVRANLSAGVIDTPKGGRSRPIPLTPPLRRALAG